MIKDRRTRMLALSGLSVFFLYTWISFILAPLAGDIKIFLASAKQASYLSPSLIVGSIKVWELKSVLSRLLAYFLYKIAVLFAPFNCPTAEIIVKAVYSLLLIGIVYLSARLVFGKKSLWATVAVSTLFMASSTDCHLQVEMTGSLLILLAFALYLNAIMTEKRSIWKLIRAGMLIGLMFWLKSILLLLSVSVVVAVCIILTEEGRKLSFKRMMTVVCGSLISLALVAGLVALINPDEFREILNAGEYQGSFFNPRIMWRESAGKFLAGHAEKPLFIPAVLLGFVCLIANLVRIFRSRKADQEEPDRRDGSAGPFSSAPGIFFHLVLWLMPALFLLISDYYFNYHFAAYLFPAVFEGWDLLRHRTRGREILLTGAAVLAAGWYAVLFSVFSRNVQTFMRLDREAYANNTAFLECIDFDPNETVLYLDDGSGAYALGNPSHLKYFFPLPLNRLQEESSMPCHVESLEKTMSYEGKYISVYDLWFFGQWRWRYKQIQEKIDAEYELIGHYDVFAPPHVILPTDDIEITQLELYQRKQ